MLSGTTQISQPANAHLSDYCCWGHPLELVCSLGSDSARRPGASTVAASIASTPPHLLCARRHMPHALTAGVSLLVNLKPLTNSISTSRSWNATRRLSKAGRSLYSRFQRSNTLLAGQAVAEPRHWHMQWFPCHAHKELTTYACPACECISKRIRVTVQVPLHRSNISTSCALLSCI